MRVLCFALVLASATRALPAIAQQPAAASPTTQEQPKPAGETRPTGLPSGLDWTFNFDAAWGTFGFMNSLYTNPKPDQPSGNLGDNWFEGSVKPTLTAAYTTSSTWQLVGKVSAVGERTYGAAPSVAGEDASSFKAEDLSFTVKSGKAFPSLSEDALEFTIGRAPYQLGHGFLILDGAAEGGSRGGYWTNARKAFQFASIATLRAGMHTAQAFYLKNDELPEASSETRLFGSNYEVRPAETTTIGATFLRFWANDSKPDRNGLDVYNVRAFTAPLRQLPALSFEFEYAREHNGDRLDSNAWTLQAAYELAEVKWTPKLFYRYAYFQGDDPTTTRNEAWDPLMPNFYDWGTWWQGEIAGEYFVANSNLLSHQVRLHLTPNKKTGTGLIFWDFLADQPGAVAPGVTARDVAFEIDWYTDWKLNANFTASFVAAFANPGKLVQQARGRTANFGYGMVFVAYHY
ncbi:MAG: alginate export family protein [Bacteroidales bacterium]